MGETIIKIKANGNCSIESRGVSNESIILALRTILIHVIMDAFEVSEKEAREAAAGAFLLTVNLYEDEENDKQRKVVEYEH